MSATSRIISGSAASWARIAVTLFSQVILIPIYLSYWDVETYGIWIAIQALVNVVSMLDKGYVDYLGFEFLKLGKDERENISKSMWSGISVIILTGLIQSLAILAFTYTNFFTSFLSEQKTVSVSIVIEARWALVFQWLGWAYCSNTTGLFFRALTVYGHYSRMAWWDTSIALLTSLLSIIVVTLGAGLLTTSIVSSLFLFLITVPRLVDIKKLMLQEQIPSRSKISLKKGIIDYQVSISLSIRYFLENFRQQGVRLILTPLVGLTNLAAFTTMRTGANVIQQGLLTITNPLLPELMRFLKEKNQQKTEASFATVWLLLVTILSPGVLILQIIIEPIFIVWTKQQITFDPILFASLSITILLYALAQPAMAIVMANNLLRPQLIISIFATVATITAIILLVPSLKLQGIGFSLMIGEILALIGFVYYAKQWLNANMLSWPSLSFFIAISSIVLTLFCLVLSYLFIDYIIFFSIITFFLHIGVSTIYIKNLPSIARKKLYSFINFQIDE